MLAAENECFGCWTSGEIEPLSFCEGCGELCCSTCKETNCACDTINPLDVDE